jgi:preprotein translocase subunit YajC
MSLNCWNIFLAQASNAASGAAAPGGTGKQAPAFMQFIPFILMFVVLYFIMIRPQSKKAKEHAALLKSVKPGDKVVTSGGVVGIIVSVKDRTVSIRSADTKMEVLKSSVSEITERSGETSSSES